MKVRALFFLLVVQAFCSFAQEKIKRSYAGFSFFAPTPVGDYRSTNISNENANYAKGSVGFGLEGAYMFHPNWGVNGLCAGYINRFNAKAYKEDFNQKQSVPFEVKANPHLVGVCMIGPIFSLPYKKVSFDVKINFGGLVYKLPKVEAYLAKNGNYGSVVIDAPSVLAVGFNPGVAARICLTKRTALKLTVDYIYSEPYVKADIVAKLNDEIIGTEHKEARTTISFVNTGVGLVFLFNKAD